MDGGKKAPVDYIGWAYRVNDTWLVHGGLDSDAAAYLDHLAEEDPVRLRRSCERAWRLVNSRGEFEDPKPWFYSGLFSLATAEEAGRFLSGHPFVAAVIPSPAGLPEPSELADAAEKTREKIALIRDKIAGLARH